MFSLWEVRTANDLRKNDKIAGEYISCDFLESWQGAVFSSFE